MNTTQITLTKENFKSVFFSNSEKLHKILVNGSAVYAIEGDFILNGESFDVITNAGRHEITKALSKQNYRNISDIQSALLTEDELLINSINDKIHDILSRHLYDNNVNISYTDNAYKAQYIDQARSKGQGTLSDTGILFDKIKISLSNMIRKKL